MSAPDEKRPWSEANGSAIRQERRRPPTAWVVLPMGLTLIVIGMADCSAMHGPIADKARVAMTIAGVLIAVAAIQSRTMR